MKTIKDILELIDKRKKIVIFDTSFLFVPFYFKIDIVDELKKLLPFQFEMLILDDTLKELSILSEDKTLKGKERKDIKIILELIQKFPFYILKTSNNQIYADIKIIDLVKKFPKKIIVASGDKELRKACLNLGCLGVVYVRKNQHLEFFSPLLGKFN